MATKKLIDFSPLELKDKFDKLESQISFVEGQERGEIIKKMIKIASTLLFKSIEKPSSVPFSLRPIYRKVKELYANNSYSGVTSLCELIYYLTAHLDEGYSERNDANQMHTAWSINDQVKTFEL